jgi:hypothetical protein
MNQDEMSMDNYDPANDPNLMGFGGYNPAIEAQQQQNAISQFNYNNANYQANPNAQEQFQKHYNVNQFTPQGNTSVPNVYNAMNESNNVKSLMGTINQIENDAPMMESGSGENNPLYGYHKSLSTLMEVINVLESTEYWLPNQSKSLAPKLDKIGKPLANHLKKYLETVKKLK